MRYFFAIALTLANNALIFASNSLAAPGYQLEVFSCLKANSHLACTPSSPGYEKIIDKKFDPEFHPIPKNTSDSSEMAKLIFASTKRHGLDFQLSGYKSEAPKAQQVFSMQVLKNHEQLHYSEFVNFADKKNNYYFFPLVTDRKDRDFFCELRQLD